MEIKIIGTGAIPTKNRSASTLIDNKILVDCGNGIIKTLLEQNIDINKIDTVLITHLHGDHFLDIIFLIMQRWINITNKKLHIYGPKGIKDIVDKLFSLAYYDIHNLKEKQNKANYEIIEFNSLKNEEVTQGYFVNSYEVIHGDIKAYGYVLKNNKSIGFSGDSSYCDNIDKIIKQTDVAVLDMTFIEGNKKHMGLNNLEMLIKKHNKKIIATHMSEESKRIAIEKNLNNLIIPNDGDKFEI